MDKVDFLKIGIEKEDYVEDMVSHRKKISKVISEGRKSAKNDKCIYCGSAKNSFCNSHSIPKFCLINIAKNGDLFYSNTFIDLPILDMEKGVNKAGTFQNICRECDSKIFQAYENPSNYINEPTSQMIAQIAMKNYLKEMSKTSHLYEIYDILKGLIPEQSVPTMMQDIQSSDAKDYIHGFEKAKRVSSKNWNGEYYVFFYEKLDYIVPLAFQGRVSLIVGFDGQIINDIYSENPNYRIDDMHICVFPLKSCSVVMMFVDSKSKRYREFYKKYNKLSLEEKLGIVNYIIFLYSEDFYLSKEISIEVLQNENLINITKQTSLALTDNPFVNVMEEAKKIHDLNKYIDIPNLLSQEYKLR